MRIVGGSLGGRRIEAVPGNAVRPTPDRVREAVFNILGQDLEGFAFLDLYSGTGAMGLEAASRGADRVVCVERDPIACDVVERNARALGIEGRIRLLRKDAILAARDLAREGRRFDVIFADPPYADPPERLGDLLSEVVSGSLLDPSGTVLLQVKRGIRPPGSPALELLEPRRYGITWVLVYRGVDGPQA